jgi:predicted NAD/FAD-dependent oxidoreductase
VGGRLATRRIGEATFDHGAQFFTTHTTEFAQIVAEWERAGIARRWFDSPSGHTRFRGAPTMNAIAKHLAQDLDVRVSTMVVALEPSDGTWQIRFADGSHLLADGIVLTAPVPQALALLDAGSVALSAADRLDLDAIRYEPCLAVLAPLDGASGFEGPGGLHRATGPIDWVADNQRKGVSAVPAVTIHATAELSRTHWESSDETVIAELVDAADLASSPVDGQVQVQRWRYARPTTIHPQRCLALDGVPPLVLAGDAFGGAKVEGAALSAMAASTAISSLLDAAMPGR